MLGDCDSVGLYPSRVQSTPPISIRGAHLTLNVAKALVDTAQAKITQARPRPHFSTWKGDIEKQFKAENLQLFADGIFDQTRAYELGTQVFKDACALGTGCIKIVVKNGKPALERVLIANILVDDALCADQAPQELFERREMARSALVAKFPKLEKQIQALTAVDVISGTTHVPDNCVVFEAWKLPIDDDNPGRHVIICQNCTLLDEEYTEADFPFAFIRWSTPSTGFYGTGLPQAIVGLQVRINRLLKVIAKNTDLFANLKLLLHNQSQVPSDHITSGFGDIVKWSGQVPPTYLQPQTSVAGDVYQHLEYLYQKCFQLTGLSTQTAFAQKPGGVTAAEALRALADIQSDRLAPVSIAYQDFYLDITRKLIACVRQLAENDDLEVSTVNRSYLQKIKWSEVSLDEDDYKIKLLGANFLGRTPAAQIQTITEYANAGVINDEQKSRLFEHPDMQEMLAQDNSMSSLFLKQIEQIVKHGIYLGPEPFDDLALGISLYQKALMRARLDNLPEEKIQLIRDWLETAQSLLEAKEAQAQAQAQPAQSDQAPDQPAQPAPMAGPPKVAA